MQHEIIDMRCLTTRLYAADDTARERVRFNVLLDILQIIWETVLQAITCTGMDNKN